MKTEEHPLAFEEKRIKEIETYEQILAELKRVAIFPRWVHIASLVDLAHHMFEKSIKEICADAELEWTPSGVAIWIACYGVWKKLKPGTRKLTSKVSYYRAVLYDPHYQKGTWSAERTFRYLLERGLVDLSIYNAVKSVRSAVSVLEENPEAIEQLELKHLKQALTDLTKLLHLISVELKKKRRKVA